jgi:hypothetical protein
MRTDLEKIVLKSIINEELILGLAEELDQPDSEISKLLDAVLVNIVLTTLHQEDRLTFYHLAELDNSDQSLKNFIWQKIPNLETKLIDRLKIILGKTLQPN